MVLPSLIINLTSEPVFFNKYIQSYIFHTTYSYCIKQITYLLYKTTNVTVYLLEMKKYLCFLVYLLSLFCRLSLSYPMGCWRWSYWTCDFRGGNSKSVQGRKKYWTILLSFNGWSLTTTKNVLCNNLTW